MSINNKIISLGMVVNFIVGGGSYLDCYLLDHVIIPYVNDVWSVAGIKIYRKKCSRRLEIKKKGGYVYHEEELLFDRRVLTDPSVPINVFVVSKSNSGVHGYTTTRENGIYHQGFIVMMEFQENDTLNLDRFSNTLAHEIGHLLGLVHNDRPGYLMYPDVLGDGTDERKLFLHEIRKARLTASSGLTPWDFSYR